MPWRPAHETHAIERVSLTLQFAEPVPSRAWQPAADEATARFQAAGFGQIPSTPTPLNMPGMLGVLIGAGSPPPMPFAANLGSPDRSFVLVENGQPTEEATIARQHIVFSANRYGSWIDLVERMGQILQPLIDLSLNTSALRLVKLEYWDRFYFDGESGSISYDELFAKGSKHLPAFSAETKNQFHSHVGYFATLEPSKRLINVNVDVVDLPSPGADQSVLQLVRSAGVYTMAQDALASDNEIADFSRAMSVSDGLHTILKQTLGDIITTDMANRISLFSRAQT